MYFCIKYMRFSPTKVVKLNKIFYFYNILTFLNSLFTTLYDYILLHIEDSPTKVVKYKFFMPITKMKGNL